VNPISHVLNGARTNTKTRKRGNSKWNKEKTSIHSTTVNQASDMMMTIMDTGNIIRIRAQFPHREFTELSSCKEPNVGWLEGSDRLLKEHYPAFDRVAPPSGSGASAAWLGEIAPFGLHSDESKILSDLNGGAIVDVCEGNLLLNRDCRYQHSDPEFSVSLSSLRGSFQILLIAFADSRHPRVYAVAPEISEMRFPNHPHLRRDLPLRYNGRNLTALCLYLASDGVVSADAWGIVRVLDYAAFFLAKHLYWKNTQTLICLRTALESRRRVYGPGIATALSSMYCCQWQGIWLGPAAPHSALAMSQLPPLSECFCSSGRPYIDCCREMCTASASMEVQRLLAS
jgi:hypothetical protein